MRAGPRDPPSREEASLPPVIDGGQLAFQRLGKVALPATYYEVFVSKKNSPGQWVTSCRWQMTALRFILLDQYSVSSAGELTLPRCKHSSALWFHRHCWLFLISHLVFLEMFKVLLKCEQGWYPDHRIYDYEMKVLFMSFVSSSECCFLLFLPFGVQIFKIISIYMYRYDLYITFIFIILIYKYNI